MPRSRLTFDQWTRPATSGKTCSRKFFELGLMGIEIPEEFGGQAGTFFQSVLAVEEIAAVDPAAAVIVDVQNTLVINAFMRWGTDEQKTAILAAAGARHRGGVRSIGSRVRLGRIRAANTRRQGQGAEFVLTGRKLWITNAAEAGLFLVFANADPEAGYKGITCFLVERGAPGFQVGHKEDKLGHSGVLHMRADLRQLPRSQTSQVLGEIGKGYKVAIETLNEGRIGIGGQMVGLAQGAFDHAVTYARQREAVRQTDRRVPGYPVPNCGNGRRHRGRRLLVYNAARLRDAGMPFVTEAAMAKYFASEVAERVASRAVEIFGGAGFTKDYPVEKLYRDAKIGRIYEGTNNMQRVLIARRFLERNSLIRKPLVFQLSSVTKEG